MKTIIGRNIYEKRVLALIAVLIVILSGIVVAYSIQSLGNPNKLVTSVGINQDVGQVWGINNTGKAPTYEIAALATGTGYVTASFAAGFNVTNIVVFESNPTYDIQGILNSSLYYSTLNVGVSEANVTGVAQTNQYNLSSVVESFGTQVNDTSIHSLGDKAITNAGLWTSLTAYSSSVNQLNKTLAFSTFGLAASNLGYMLGININVQTLHALSATNHVVVKINQSFGSPFHVDLITVFIGVEAVALLAAAGLIFLGMPRIKGGK